MSVCTGACVLATSGIDLALRVVERYLGRSAAAGTARYMEHESSRWRSA